MDTGDFGNQVGGTGPADQPGPYGQPQHGNVPQYGQPGGYGQPSPYGQPGPYPGQVWRRTNALAIASLCCGVGQLVVGILAGIPAIVLGFFALSQIRRTGENGRGMAIAGIVLGFLSFIVTAVLILALLVLANGLSNNHATF